jgi:hypothetical protein
MYVFGRALRGRSRLDATGRVFVWLEGRGLVTRVLGLMAGARDRIAS